MSFLCSKAVNREYLFNLVQELFMYDKKVLVKIDEVFASLQKNLLYLLNFKFSFFSENFYFYSVKNLNRQKYYFKYFY